MGYVFQTGDKVVCVDADVGGSCDMLTAGQEYTVSKVSHVGTMSLEHGGGVYWNMARFRLVQCAAEAAAPVPGRMSPPTTSAERKAMPVFSGCLNYFPAALQLVSVLSKLGNDKHNPGEPLHHARGKSMDHGDCIVRHQLEAGTIDPDTGLDHAVGVAWRALAQLQELAEKRYGWPMAPGAKEG